VGGRGPLLCRCPSARACAPIETPRQTTSQAPLRTGREPSIRAFAPPDGLGFVLPCSTAEPARSGNQALRVQLTWKV
jgi:hypothetical protein